MLNLFHEKVETFAATPVSRCDASSFSEPPALSESADEASLLLKRKALPIPDSEKEMASLLRESSCSSGAPRYREVM
jgi:hypothetical protein